jgi:hypothetical protein
MTDRATDLVANQSMDRSPPIPPLQAIENGDGRSCVLSLHFLPQFSMFFVKKREWVGGVGGGRTEESAWKEAEQLACRYFLLSSSPTPATGA